MKGKAGRGCEQERQGGGVLSLRFQERIILSSLILIGSILPDQPLSPEGHPHRTGMGGNVERSWGDLGCPHSGGGVVPGMQRKVRVTGGILMGAYSWLWG